MFERALLVHNPVNATSDSELGLLAQVLVFYDGVTVALRNEEALAGLVKRLGERAAESLVSRGRLEFKFVNAPYSFLPERENRLTPVSWEFDDPVIDEDHFWTRLTDDHGISTSLAARLRSALTFEALDAPRGARAPLGDRLSVAMALLSDPGKADTVMRICLEQHFPEYDIPPDCRYSVQRDLTGWRIETNLDCELLTRIASVRRGRRQIVSPSSFAAMFLEAVGMAMVASAVRGDLAPGVTLDPLVTLVVNDAVRRSLPVGEFALFEDLVLDGAGSIGRAVTEGGRTFLELAELLEKKQRFSLWLRDTPSDRKISREYIKYLKDGSWLDRFSGKAARCALFTGAGLVAGAALAGPVGAAAGAGLGIFDGLILDRIVGGWRPNQFVEGPLSDFVTPPSTSESGRH